MKLLVVHAWMRGNLGDVLQLSVLLSALRALRPDVLDLAGHPARPSDATGELLQQVDRYIADPFIWYWKFLPGPIASGVLTPWWRRQRTALFSRYDAVVCAPGPYLADYDARSPSALADLRIARAAGRPIVLSSHSIGPLGLGGIEAVRQATACVARESATHQYLGQRGVASTLAADYAFLYPFSQRSEDVPVKGPCRVAFLRSNNLRSAALRRDGNALYFGDDLLVEPSDEPLVLATSDISRDDRFLAAAAARLGVPYVACRSVAQMVELVRRSSGVVSDRYHPAICAASLGRPVRVVPNREPHKMQGLATLLAEHSIAELQDLARAGLDTVRQALRTVA